MHIAYFKKNRKEFIFTMNSQRKALDYLVCTISFYPYLKTLHSGKLNSSKPETKTKGMASTSI